MNKICQKINCDEISILRGKYCEKHRTRPEKIQSEKICFKEDCNEISISRGKYCEKHKIKYKIKITNLTNDTIKYSKAKICTICNIKKSTSEFYQDNKKKDNLCNRCKKCMDEYCIKYRNTLNGSLQTLLDRSKKSAKSRKEKGRLDAGISNITLLDLKELWEKQNGKCYYSNIPMNYDKRDWKVSLERLNPNKGYIKDNIVLCCQEFNCQTQWSKEKIHEMISIFSEDIIRHTFSFDLEQKIRKTQIKIKKYIIDNMEHYNCTYCKEIKSRDMFNNIISSGCKNCIKERAKTNRNNPRFCLQILFNSAKRSTKERIKIINAKRNNSFDIDFEYLIKLYNKQRGLCAYSKLPLQFGSYLEKNWTCSLERIDVKKGYIKGNVCLICLEFNTTDKTIDYKYEEEGSGGWNKTKFNFFNNILHNSK